MDYLGTQFWVTVVMLGICIPFIQNYTAVRNILLLGASYLIITLWSPFLLLPLLYVTLVSFGTGLMLRGRSDAARKLLMGTAIVLLLLPLVFHKVLFPWLPGLEGIRWLLFPLGLSFYTFQAIGYVVDVYRRTSEPEESFLVYALFLAFFPKFVAGPIERSTNFLVQLRQMRPLTGARVSEGLYLVTWGLVQKLCIAQLALPYVGRLFNADTHVTYTHALSGPLALSLYFYMDFAGYTNIALGTAHLLGFDLLENFRMPYFARNPSDFWRRWHMSLSNWVRDYIYIPLGGSRQGLLRTLLHLLIIMLIIGAWHGTTAIFLLWGLFHGVLLVLHRLLRACSGKVPPAIVRIADSPFLSVPLTFALVTVGWILFASNSTEHFRLAITALGMAFADITPVLQDPGLAPVLLAWLPVLLIDGIQAYTGNRFAIPSMSKPKQMLFYYACLYALIFLSLGENYQFIYAGF